MARGIDFKTVNSVINFDFPTSLVSYIHRVGRTGRAGREGTATTYFTDSDTPFIHNIANLMKKSGHEVPEWMLNLKSAGNKEWKKIENKLDSMVCFFFSFVFGKEQMANFSSKKR